MALGEAGVLKKYNVELIGASLEAIDRGEDRELFKKVVDEAGAESARSDIAHSIEEVDKIAEKFGYPLVVRPSFTMGGLGSGIAHNEEELHRIAGAGIHYSPTDEVLIEEGIEGWKEFELELMRDRNDNVVVVCPIENVDPVGVHTGDSITVAPCFTLTDREYQKLRDIGIAIIRGVGVDTGGCNIQFAVHPGTGRIIVIEMNPRVSRSSALASKATGFPIAKIATKLALGYTLDEIRNDITQSTPASFEPTIDYVVTKVPRFAFEKFPGADPTLTTSMKSVGEAMALAGNFQESLGKAMRSIDKRHMGFNWDGEKPSAEEVAELLETIHTPTEHRYLQLMRAIWGGATLEQVFAATKIDPWFLKQIFLINETAMTVREAETLTPKLLKKAKLAGLSDVQVAHLRGLGDEGENTIRELRWTYGLRPVYKTVDTCAAEFDAATPYYYSCYADETELRPREREAVIILGSGPNRIGQGIEFDYTCVHAVQELGKNYDTIMVNCNPETVSTDYDMSDRLYFEPLTFEDVLEIYEAEKKMGPIKGVIVQLGGQTPLSLAARLKAAGVPILGTTPESIDLAENRELFGEVLKKADMNAPRYGTALSLDEAREAAWDAARAAVETTGGDIRVCEKQLASCEAEQTKAEEDRPRQAKDAADRFFAQHPLLEPLARERFAALSKDKGPRYAAQSAEKAQARLDDALAVYLTGTLEPAQKEYNTRYVCDHPLGLTGIEQYRAQHESLVRIDLERYAARLEQAQRDCKDRFRKDILFRMKDDIFNARRQFRELNKVMEQLTYGEEVYRFELEPSRDPQLAAFYQVIVDKGNQQMTEGDSLDNLAATADPAYERQVDELMEKIMSDVDENTRARQEGRTGGVTLSDYVDYRTYLDYDIKVTNRVTGQQAYLSRVSRDSSGGENQAPFYVAICASLLQIYEKSENSIRLVLLDEAFSKMTSDRIRPMMELFRRLQLQVLLISTVEKSTAIQPYCDITYSIVRHGDTNAIAPFIRLAAE